MSDLRQPTNNAKLRVAITALFASLFVGSIVLWVGSVFWSFVYTHPIIGGYWQIGASHGQIGLKILLHYVDDDSDEIESLDPVPPKWSRSSPPVPFTPIHQNFGFGAFHRHNEYDGGIYVAIFDFRLALIPIWPISLVALLPLAWLLRPRARRHTGRGFAVHPIHSPGKA